jgi:hypothetical protein
MPFGTCTRCNHFYALDNERAPQTYCPRCEQPLRFLPREEAVAALRRLEERPSSLPASPMATPPDGDLKARSAIPDSEMKILAGTIVEVVGQAVHKHREEGCTSLVSALCYAEQNRVAGQSWGEALVQRYQDVLDAYATRYAVRVE